MEKNALNVMNESIKHDAPIKRVDERFVSLNDVPVRDVRLTREEWTQIRTTVLNCRAALSQSEPVRYVPMTDDAWEKLYAEYEAICFDKSPSPRYIEAEVIRRAIAQGAKLEVQE